MGFVDGQGFNGKRRLANAEAVAERTIAASHHHGFDTARLGGGSDVANLKTRAVRDGDHYIVNGAKTFITSGTRADYYTVAVRTGEAGFGGISLLLIERDTPGFSTGRALKKMGWWASDTAELFFLDCRVPAANLIGGENLGFYTIMSNFQSERLALSVMAYMTAQLALDACLAYVTTRETFGRPLARHQVIRHKLAEMATEIENMFQAHGGKLKASIDIKIELTREVDGFYLISAKHKIKLPETARKRSVAWLTEDNLFTPNMPRQGQFFGVRDVTPRRAPRN